MLLFDALIAAHIVTGATGLVSLWGPVVTRNGSRLYKPLWGRIFVCSMPATGAIALGISMCFLYAPFETHPFSDDKAFIRGMLG